MYAYVLVLSHVQVKFDHFQSTYILYYYNFTFFLQMKRQRPRWLAQVRSRPALFTPKGEPVGANPLPPHRTLYLLCLLREKDVQMAHLARLKYLGIGSDRWVTPPPSWEVIENMYAKNSSNCFAQKTNSIKPNRAVRDRKGQRRDEKHSLTLISNHFLYT